MNVLPCLRRIPKIGRYSAICWLFAAVAGAGTARAGVLYDNLGAAPVSSDAVSVLGPLADSFSTGSSSADLTDVKVLLQGNSSGGAIEIDLMSDAGTAPGAFLTALGTLNDSALTNSPTVFDFPLAVPFSLAANTRYWVEIISANSSTAQWDWSSDITGPGVAGEFFYSTGAVLPNIDGPYQMQVNATSSSVPEPASLTILAAGLAGLAAARRRFI